MKTHLGMLDKPASTAFTGRWWLRITLALLYLAHLSSVAHGQAKQWDRTFGGGADDHLTSLQQTSDGGYILGGWSSSPISGDKTAGSKGRDDYWVVKLDANGSKEWDRTFGGNRVNRLSSLQQTSDGGYILGGESSSPVSGDKTEASRGGFDYWVVKLNASGEREWDRTFGGGRNDNLTSLQETSDGGYILGGHSTSPISGDKTEATESNDDYWLVKLDAAGTKEWDKAFGGSGFNVLYSLQQTSDGGYILGGTSSSDISGDKTEASRGGADYWVMKLDAVGTKQWDRTFGGSDYDELQSLQQTSDGGYILGGSSGSPASGDKTQALEGEQDYWVVKLSGDVPPPPSLAKQWDRTYGGSGYDELRSVQQTSDGGYILGGYSTSPVSGDKTEINKGFCVEEECSNDYWVLKLNAAGEKEWDRTFGGNGYDELLSLQQTSDGGYILGGWSDSGISGDKSEANEGGDDYWVVKLNAAGAKEWDRTFGGGRSDDLTSLQQTSDGGYILGGWSDSGISGDITQASRGGIDYWVVKLSEGGEKEWDRTLGGNNSDFLFSL
jgi:hypothetical protein